MKISVVLPCYNASNNIIETLDSINRQTLQQIECVIINDGSTDNTHDLIVSYKFREGISVIYISRENKGFLFSLQEGIDRSSNELIARIDSDDIWEPNHLELLSSVLEKENLVFVGSNATLINDKGDEIGFFNVPTTNKMLLKRLLNDNAIIHSSVIFRKDIYYKTSGYICGEGDFYKHIADYNLWVEMSAWGRCRNVQERTVRYRYLDNSMSRSINRLTNYKARRHVMLKMFHFHKTDTLFFIKSLIKVELRIIQSLLCR